MGSRLAVGTGHRAGVVPRVVGLGDRALRLSGFVVMLKPYRW